MRKVLIALTAIAAIGLSSGCGYFEALEKERVKQSKDFQADLEAQGFSPKKVERDEEQTGKHSSELAFEAPSSLKGCTVELERDEDEDQVVTTVDGRKIEAYELDEVRDKSNNELDFDEELMAIAPNENTVLDYLRKQKASCLTA